MFLCSVLSNGLNLSSKEKEASDWSFALMGMLSLCESGDKTT
jgi:hypothetical protein